MVSASAELVQGKEARGEMESQVLDSNLDDNEILRRAVSLRPSPYSLRKDDR